MDQHDVPQSTDGGADELKAFEGLSLLLYILAP